MAGIAKKNGSLWTEIFEWEQLISYLPEGVKMLAEIVNETLEDLPKQISDKVNKIFLNSMIRKIRELKQIRYDNFEDIN